VSELLRRAIILDTETLGLERGAGMHELAFMDVQSRNLQSFVLNPNAVTIQTMPQEHTKLASTSADQYTAHKYSNWMHALHAQVERQAGAPVPRGQTMALLREQQPWLASMIQHYPHLLGASSTEINAQNAARTTRFEKLGIKANLGKQVGVEDALGTLKQVMSGKTVWIANAVFESKQVGAQLGALGPEAAEQFKSGLETWNPQSPDPFYVTGSEVTRARTRAQANGDWTGVWKAYLQNQPKAGETAVRDIQDVTRALHSYGKKLGFTEKDLNYLGTGVDISHRLHALAEGNTERIGMREVHRAAEDVAIHESYVLERGVKLTSALQHVAEGTELGKRYLKEGSDGVLGQVSMYFQALEEHSPILQEEQALKRLQRAQQDILKQGFTQQRQGGLPFAQSQLTPKGQFTQVWRTRSTRTNYSTMDQVLGHVRAEGRYDQVDLDALWQRMSQHSQDEQGLNRYVHDRLSQLRNQYSQIQVGGASARLSKVLQRPKAGVGLELMEMGVRAARGRAGVFAGAAAALSAIGATASVFQQQPARPESILHYGYDEWVSRQQIEGMSEGAVAKQQRHSMTDFGSPYRGPVGVQQVFIDQEMLREREKWLRVQYGAQHYQNKVPSLPTWSPFIGGGYDFVKSGQTVAGADYGMRGDLKKINIKDGNWKLTADDADTVTIRRGGLTGALQDFFGLNKSYSFRLAGLDSPEVAHGDRPAQPFANQATQAFQAMLAGASDIDLIFNPNEITYGRALGAVYADGRNLNYELVKRGIASHLPFGKAQYASINYAALKEAETRAYQTNRGMWSQPWARSFYEHTAASGNRVTFNQLANPESVVKNAGTMMMVSAMNAAQTSGQFTPASAALAADLGSRYNVGADHVGPQIMSAASTPSTSYMQEQLQDLAGFIRTKGRNENSNKLSHRNGYGRLDAVMALDTVGTSNQIHSKRRSAAFKQYGSGKALSRARKARMALHQRKTLQALSSSSPIGHHRM